MRNWILKLFWPTLLAFAVLQVPVDVAAQAAWPNRPIKLVVPYPPGGNSDNVGRLVAERLGAHLNTTVIVDNKPGGTTQVGTELVARANPDGYTILCGAATAFTVLPHQRTKLPYDPKNGFEVLGGVAQYLTVLAVRNDLGVNSLADLIKLAKANPGKLTFGSAGIASVGHISGEILKRDAGINMVHVPYKGSADAATALMGGHIDMLIDGTTVALAKAGKVKGIVAFGLDRHPEMPNLPSLVEAGLQNVRISIGAQWGLFAPKGTPAPICARLSQALEKMLAEPETRKRLERVSALAYWQTPDELRKALESDYNFYGELLPAIGIRKED